MLMEGVHGWFEGPVFCAVRVECESDQTADVLTRIDALMDWQSCSPTCKPALGRSGIGRPQGYDSLVRFKCLLIGQWHPEAGAGALNCGWISCCCVAVSTGCH
ncbi:MAG: hypothetical protein GDA36_05310 [Rhodobacteraceae bacterium]|nr:hypothetical protein [Paracoccaceae bacterium]